MFSVLCDVITYDNASWLYIDGFPCRLLDELESVSGHPFTDDVIVVNMQYGESFEKFKQDPFNKDRTVEKSVT